MYILFFEKKLYISVLDIIGILSEGNFITGEDKWLQLYIYENEDCVFLYHFTLIQSKSKSLRSSSFVSSLYL